MPQFKTIYLPHPVSPETKAKHIAAGERILDIRFAPQGYQAEPAPAPAPIAEPENGVEEMPKRRGRPKLNVR